MMLRHVLLVSLVLAGSARADEPATTANARARELDHQGRAAHDVGDYAAAIAAYKEAYVLAPSPGVLFNLAQAYRLNGDCVNAALMYRRYLGSSPDEDEREIAEMHLANVEHCTPPRTTAIMEAKPARLALTAPVVSGNRTERRIGAGLLIAGGAMFVASVYFAVDAHDASADVSRFYAKGGAWSAIEATDARGRSSARWADGLLITGGISLLAGGALCMLGYRSEHLPPLQLTASAHGAHASLSWRF
jgi:tetratricopeptide (TPR) repeat protein